MQILLACAKIMNETCKSCCENFPVSVPMFIHEAEAFVRDLMTYDERMIQELLSCNSQLAAVNKLRYMSFFDAERLSFPAIFAYNGQAYKHLKASTFSADDLLYAQHHLWITSFLYGLLRPSDAIRPYRLEGNVSLPSGGGKNMFDFWKYRLTDVLIDSVKADDGILIHLATDEFQHMFDWKRLSQEVRIIRPLFLVRKGRNLKIQAVWAKSCRGAMTRFLIQNRIQTPEELTAFSYEGFEYCPHIGESDFPHFVRGNE